MSGMITAWFWTVVIEGVVLWFLLPPIRAPRLRLGAALWLSSCTIPVVHLSFPVLTEHGWTTVWWIAAAELFAPLAECLLFAAILRAGRMPAMTVRDATAIVVANLISFGSGELWYALR